MHKKIHSKERVALICLCLGMVLFGAHPVQSEANKISFSVSGGAGYLPLDDWKDFFSGSSSTKRGNSPLVVENSYPVTPFARFEKDQLGTYLDFRIAYHLTDKHTIAINIENIKKSARLKDVDLYLNYYSRSGPPDTGSAFPYVIDWDFESIPVGLSYEYYPNSIKAKLSPFIGMGVSYFFSEVNSKLNYLGKSPYQDVLYMPGYYENPQKSHRDGSGYGLQIYAGLEYHLNQHLSTIFRLRARYADGMAFTDKPGAIKVEFTGVDFTLGLGWRF